MHQQKGCFDVIQEDNYGENQMLDDYIDNNFAVNGKLNFSNMNLISNLLLCCVPNTFLGCVPRYREKLKVHDVFDCDIDNSNLSSMQKKIIKEKIGDFDKENCKICGFVLYSFMLKQAQGLELTNISFLTTNTNF